MNGRTTHLLEQQRDTITADELDELYAMAAAVVSDDEIRRTAATRGYICAEVLA
jgi:hypothetical protein